MKNLFFLFFLFICSLGKGQDKTLLLIQDKDSVKIDALYFTDVSSVERYLILLKNKNVLAGYLSYSIDKLVCLGDSCFALVYAGKHYKISEIIKKGDSLSDDFIPLENGSREKYSPLGYRKIFSKSLSYFENNGYPFAEVKIDEVVMVDSSVFVNYHIRPNVFFKIDTIFIKSEDKIDSRIISKIIGITTNDVYDESKILTIKNNLVKSTFYSESKPFEILFTDSGAQLFLYLKKKSSNFFSGIIGLQSDEVDAKLAITGEVKAKFNNNFQRGESISLFWKKLPSLSQQFNLDIIYPYILFSNVGLNGALSIYKQDSAFINVKKKLEISYKLSSVETVGVFIDDQNSFNQSSLEEGENENVDVRSLGVSYGRQSLKRIINPVSGFSLTLSYGVGKRTISDSIGAQNLDKFQHRSIANFYIVIPIYNRLKFDITLHEEFNTGKLQYENELIRFGGFNSIRGFNEYQLRATSLLVGTFQVRYILDRGSNLHVFLDQGWYERNSIDEYVQDQPYGIGVGFSFTTKAGVFGFDYALGSQFDNSLDFRSGKIHFGLSALF